MIVQCLYTLKINETTKVVFYFQSDMCTMGIVPKTLRLLALLLALGNLPLIYLFYGFELHANFAD